MSSSQVGSGVVGELKWELPRLTDFTGDAHRAGSACSGRRISLMIFCSAGVRSWPEPARAGYGQSTAALPGTSDIDFLGDLKRVVDVNA
jgi:hypothetical protein